MSFPRYLAALLVLALIAAGPAHAQRGGSRQAEQDIERLLDEARQAYDNLELDQADAALEQAVQIGERAGVRGRAMAEVHVQRGIIAHVRDKDKDRAVDEFKQALVIDRTVRLDSLVSTPSLEALFEQARRSVGTGGGESGRGQADDQIVHKPIKRARANEIMTVQAKVTRELREQMYRMYLYFRSQKADAVRRIEMKDQGDSTFVARIAAKYVRGNQLGYYILVEDRDGNQIAQVHGSQDPIQVEIEDMPTGGSLLGEEGGEEGGDEGSPEEEEDTGSRRDQRIVSIGLSVGAGAGRITDKAEAHNTPESALHSGMAIAPFHTLVELDFWVTKALTLGAFARIQIADFAHAEGGRLKYEVFKAGSNRLQLRGGGGYGYISHQVPLEAYRDYTLEGPFFYTLGVAYTFEFAKIWGLTIAPDFYHLIGPSPSQHFDLNVGMRVSF